MAFTTAPVVPVGEKNTALILLIFIFQAPVDCSFFKGFLQKTQALHYLPQLIIIKAVQLFPPPASDDLLHCPVRILPLSVMESRAERPSSGEDAAVMSPMACSFFTIFDTWAFSSLRRFIISFWLTFPALKISKSRENCC
jgi:hypothetical protein